MSHGSPVPLVTPPGSSGQHVILVDVGYLYAAAGELLGLGSQRRHLRVDSVGLIGSLVDRAAAAFAGQRLLRLYWFDAARQRVPTPEQQLVGRQENVKLRLGNVNSSGQQKGVDALIHTVITELAQHHAVCDAVLVSGDEDLTSALEVAQSYGVRVHLWAVQSPRTSNLSQELVGEADTVTMLDAAAVAPFVDAAPVDPDSAGPVSRADALSAGRAVAQEWLATRDRDTLAVLLPGPTLPQHVHHELLEAGERLIGSSLRGQDDARRALREGLLQRLGEELAPPEGPPS